MNSTGVLVRAKRKLEYSKDLKELHAWLTPTEIHALIDAGYKPTPGSRIPARNEPAPKPTWFYFLPVRGEFYE